MFRILLVISFYFFAVQSLNGQSKSNNIEAYVNSLSKNQSFSGNILVVENNEIIYQNAVGYADYPNKIPNNLNINFPIASISKILTATAILQLKEKGLINIEDNVSLYLPEFPYPNLKVKHLLSHTSGLPPYNAYFDEERKKDTLRKFVNKDFLNKVVTNKQLLVYQPGEKGNYDNINYIVLALIIEKLSGQTYEDYIKKCILIPAKMNETNFMPLPYQFNHGEIVNFAYPHVYLHVYDSLPTKSNTIPYVKNYWHSYGFNGFGDYVSTVNDLWKFDIALYSDILLKQSTLNDAYNPMILNNGDPNEDRFGLGWEIEKDTSFGKLVYHSGAAMGLSSIILRNVTKHQAVILFDNAHFNAHYNALNIMKLLNGKHIEMPKKSIANIYGQTLLKSGPIKAKKLLNILSKDTLQYYLIEDEMNTLGYDFLASTNPYHLPLKHFYKEALCTFKTNLELFPKSWNAYDSYGDAFMTCGMNYKAIIMFKKSLELNPNNENGKMALKKLLN